MFTDCVAMKRLIDKADVVSFDIFDTLILRHFLFPVDIFSVVEKETNVQGFKKARIKAEQKARSLLLGQDKEEVTLSEIYSYLSEEYKNLQHKELAAELKYCLPNKEMVEVFKHALSVGKRVVITSEMYLPEDIILKMLSKCGIEGYEKLYLSSTILKVKGGSLYTYLLNDLKNVAPAKIVHVGDSLHGDILPAKKVGITTGYYQHILDQFIQYGMIDSKLLDNIRDAENLDLSFLAKICAMFVSQNKQKDDEGHFFIGATIVWPLVMLFNNWLCHCCENRGIDSIFFLSRDGFIFQSVFDLVQNKADQFKSKKLFVSRKSLSIPVESCLDPDFDLLMYGLHSEMSFEELWGHLDINSSKLKKSFQLFLKRHAVKECSVPIHLLREFLKEHRADLMDYYSEEKKLIAEYLEGLSMFDSTSALVDIGWSGTMQRSIKLLATELGYLPNSCGFYFGSREGCVLDGADFEAFTSKKGYPESINQIHKDVVDIEELLFTVPATSVRKLQRNANGEVAPVFYNQAASEQSRLAVSEQINMGLLEITSFYLQNNFDEIFSFEPIYGKEDGWLFLDSLRRLSSDYLNKFSEINVFYSHNTEVAESIQFCGEKINA